jgi:hypothetical protein
MRKKLTATLCALAVFATAGTALAIVTYPVAIFNFTNPNDINSFQKVAGGSKCVKKLRAQVALGINVGDTSPTCAFRTSVIADSQDTSPSQQISATVSWEKKTPVKQQRKLYLSVLTRASATGHYELRIVPVKQKWALIRDPDGAAPATTMASGTLKKIKPGATKPNTLLLQTFAGTGTSVSVFAQIDGVTVLNSVDTGSSPPAGRFNEVAVGSKTGASALDMLGSFDDITISVPSPF